MQALLSLRIGQRLGVAFGLVLLLLAATAGLALRHMGDIRQQLDEIVLVNNVEYQLVAEMRIAADGLAQHASAMIMLDDAVAMKSTRAAFDHDLAAYDAAEKKLGEHFAATTDTDPRETALLAQVRQEQDAMVVPMNKAMDLAATSQNMDAGRLMAADAIPAQAKLFASLGALLKVEDELTKRAYDEANGVYARSRALLLVLAACAMAIAAAAAWLITRSIVVPIGEAVKAAECVAAGDLTHRIAIGAQGRDETSQLLRAMHAMQGKLSQVVARVREGADGVATASAQIAQGNNDLSARTEQQASALEQTAASMEQLGATVRHNADNARQADQFAQGTSTSAASGGQVVGEVVETMRGIQESSRRIADIIGVIDGIAFQTNILALNAAVEAARAGEQGRGFAVVASEVRGLAQRSAAAAREIKSLITASVERVEQGSALADRAGATMGEIVGGIRRVTDLMGEISAASSEQSRGVAQVGEAVTQMDKGTQQNAAMVEEMAAAASSLRTRAAELVDVVNVFRVDDALVARA